jgi:hypothetical protein
VQRPEAVDQLRAHRPLHVLQIGYNLLERQADAFLHWAQAENIGTLIRVPLGKGMLTGKYSGAQAVAMPPGDHRYERFQRPGTVDGLQKLPQLGFSCRCLRARWCRLPCALCSVIPACHQSSPAPRLVSKSKRMLAPRPCLHSLPRSGPRPWTSPTRLARRTGVDERRLQHPHRGERTSPTAAAQTSLCRDARVSVRRIGRRPRRAEVLPTILAQNLLRSPHTTGARDRHVNIMSRVAALSGDETAIVPIGSI